MRKSVKVLSVAFAAIGIAWIAYPPARDWPGLRQVRETLAFGLGAAGMAVPEMLKSAEKSGGGKGPAPVAKGSGGPVPIRAAMAVNAEMPVVLSAPGTVEAIATAGVKPRVDGQIAEIAFKEGDLVRAGQVLFRLDDRLINAAIRLAEANIAKDKAALKDAELILGRREALVSKKIVSEAATDTQRSTVEALKASIVAGESALEAQRTQLDYLTIKAPITGRTGTIKTELGVNVRTGDTTPLVVINQTQPITVAFAVPQSDLAPLRRALASGALCVVKAAGEKPVEASGKLVFIDNQVDKQTGTLMAKVEVPNDGEVLWPGQAVGISLTVETRPGFVAVPTSAVLPSQVGMIAWVVGNDNKVQPKPVTLERVAGDLAFVSSGLRPGDRVVTDGQLRLAPGTTVAVRQPEAPGSPAGNAKTGGEASDKSAPASPIGGASRASDRGRS